MRKLVFIFLLFVASLARAAPVCIPGIYGDVWPGSHSNIGVKTANGLHAYFWCVGKTSANVLVPLLVYRTCVPGESCLAWPDIGAKFGELVTNATSGSKFAVFASYYDHNPAAYRCGFAGELPAERPIAAPDSNSGRACAELKALIDADAPIGALPTTPPPPGQWVTPATGSFRLYTAANGALVKQITDRTSGPNIVCHCDVNRATLGTAVYCAPDVSKPTEVTACKAPP